MSRNYKVICNGCVCTSPSPLCRPILPSGRDYTTLPLCAWPYRQLPQTETENSTTNPDKLIIHKSITFLKAEMFSVNSHSAKL